MEIKTLIFLVLITILTSCSHTIKSQPVENQEKIENEFYTFFDRFKNDSLFQTNRIDFPLKVEIIQETDENGKDIFSNTLINKDQWKYNTFQWDSTFMVRELDKYSQRIEIINDSAIVYWEGIDNGLDIRLIFLKLDNNWFFEKHLDLSD